MCKLSKLSKDSVIIGSFQGKQICFLLSSCSNGPNGVIITELKDLDEERPGVIPKTLKLADKGLITASVPKHIIKSYLNIPASANNQQNVKKANNQQNVKRGTYAFAH